MLDGARSWVVGQSQGPLYPRNLAEKVVRYDLGPLFGPYPPSTNYSIGQW
jgi:hypothetical protein